MKKNFTIIAANMTGKIKNANTTTLNPTPVVSTVSAQSGARLSLYSRLFKMTLLALVILSCFTATAQLNIGSSSAPNPYSILQLTSTNKGLLLPQVALVQTTSSLPLGGNVAGMVVYNTATANDVTPGVYINNGIKWLPLNTSVSPPATYTSSTIDCSGALSGMYSNGVAMNSADTKLITITANTGGTYTATTNTVNGVTFASSGTLYSTGAGTQVTLVATGTPAASGTFSYLASLGGQSCSFSVTFATAATFSCAGATQVQSPVGSLTNNAGYTGSFTIPYSGGNGTTYASSTETISGLTLARVAGTYSAGGGNIVYNLTGTYTGSTNGVATFTIPECTTTTFGSATYTASTISCSGALSGTYSAGIPMTISNTKVVTITTATGGAYNASTDVQNGVSFSVSGVFSSAGAGSQATLVASGTPSGPGSFTYTASLGGQTCTFPVTFAQGATMGCSGATQTQSPAASINSGTVYTGSYTIPYTSGNGGTYSSSTQTINGLTLTRVAGSYIVGGGNVVYNLSGTSIAAGSVTFIIPECTITTFGDAIRRAMASAGCASCTAYDAAALNNWVKVTSAEYTALQNASNIIGTGIGGYSNSYMSVGPSGNAGVNYTFGGQNPSGQFPANSYVIAFSYNGLGSVGTNIGAKVKVGTGANTGYTSMGPALPNYDITNSPVYYYFIAKRPNFTTPAVSTYLGFYSGSISSVSWINGPLTYFDAGDVSNLNALNSQQGYMFQGISTTTQQW